MKKSHLEAAAGTASKVFRSARWNYFPVHFILSDEIHAAIRNGDRADLGKETACDSKLEGSLKMKAEGYYRASGKDTGFADLSRAEIV